MKRILWILMILSAIPAAPVAAQDHTPMSRLGQNFTPAPPQSLQFLMRSADTQETPEQRRLREEQEEKDRLAACERAKLPDSTPLGFYGHRHAEAHCKGWVRELQASVGSKCCSSPYTGECRVSRYDPVLKMVEVDGMMSPVPPNIRWGVIHDLEPDRVLVCAGTKWKGPQGKWFPAAVHCIGGAATY